MKRITDLNKDIDTSSYTKGQKWNDTYTVIEVDPNYVIIAELFQNGNVKRSTRTMVTSKGLAQKL